MARRTFFSFHYERDVWRAGQVRNSWLTKDDREAAGFWDAAKWEEVKKKGEDAIHKWIDDQLNGTSVTVVLIGAETSTRKYVDYEITQSHKKNGILGIYVHDIKTPTLGPTRREATRSTSGPSKIRTRTSSPIRLTTG